MTKILIADDADVVRLQVRMMFESAGYEVVDAVNGLEALKLLSENPDVSLIMTDVNMPEMDGMTFCERVSSNPKFKGLPLVMLTTESAPQFKVMAREAGVRLWLTKPYDETQVLIACKKLITEYQNRPAPVG